MNEFFCSSSCKPLLTTLPTLYNLGKTPVKLTLCVCQKPKLVKCREVSSQRLLPWPIGVHYIILCVILMNWDLNVGDWLPCIHTTSLTICCSFSSMYIFSHHCEQTHYLLADEQVDLHQANKIWSRLVRHLSEASQKNLTKFFNMNCGYNLFLCILFLLMTIYGCSPILERGEI